MNTVRLAPRAWISLGAGAATAAAIGVGLFVFGPFAAPDGPGATPPPNSSATPTPTESPTGLQTSDAAPVVPESGFEIAREASLDDATALARLTNPRTGETWHAPVERPEYAEAFARFAEVGPAEHFFSVGERDGYDIVLAASDVAPVGNLKTPGTFGTLGLWQGMFEIRDGVPILIAGPWENLGTCVDYYPSNVVRVSRFLVDDDVFYDSLSYPTGLAVDPFTMVTLHEWEAWTSGCQFGYPGSSLPWEREFGSDEVANVVDQGLHVIGGGGPVDFVRLEWASEVTGLVNGQYYARTPYDTLLTTYSIRPAGGGFGAITWLDGHRPTDPTDQGWRGISPAAGDTCWDPTQFTREVNHVDGDWVLAGTSVTGVDLYVPVDGGNPVALSVYTRMRDKSSMDGWENLGPWSNSRSWVSPGRVATEEVPPYAYATYEAFLADNALFAYQAPDGSWLLVVRGSALYTVYECS